MGHRNGPIAPFGVRLPLLGAAAAADVIMSTGSCVVVVAIVAKHSSFNKRPIDFVGAHRRASIDFSCSDDHDDICSGAHINIFLFF